MIDLEKLLKKVGWAFKTCAPPHDSFSSDLQWLEVFSSFGASGFVRTLANDEEIVVQAVHPKIEPNAIVKALQEGEEKWKQSSGFFSCPLSDEERALAVFSRIEALAKVLVSDNAVDAFKHFIGEDEKCTSSSGEFEVIGSQSAPDREKESGERKKSSVAQNEKVQSCSNAFGFQILQDESIDLLIGISPEMNAHKFERFGDIVVRNLRAKFDIKPRLGEGRVSEGFGDYAHRLHVICEVEEGSTKAASAEIYAYLQRLNDLSEAGIDPLVFLGIDDSTKSEKKQESLQVEDVELPSGEFVLDIGSGKKGTRLEKGNFEDKRLRGRDASTALVDVILRHPGYSDKNMGQVLSILLSIEYHEALELIEDAPTSLAWAVNRERGQMFKTVIEGAGGKVYLSEPGAFDAD